MTKEEENLQFFKEGLDHLLGADLYKKLKANLKKESISLDSFKNVKLALAFAGIVSQIFSKNHLPVDVLIFSEALKNKKKIIGLETLKFQIPLLMLIPEINSASNFIQLIMDPDHGSTKFNKMKDIYIAGNPEELFQLSKLPTKELNEKLLDERNINWVPVVLGHLKKEICFMAVGAAHLGGENGLLNLFRNQGFEIFPIGNNKGTKVNR